jgi:hypothetical protein
MFLLSFAHDAGSIVSSLELFHYFAILLDMTALRAEPTFLVFLINFTVVFEFLHASIAA